MAYYPNVLIGLPCYQRDWILPHWFRAIENQNYPLENIGFIFELGDNDEQTYKVLFEWHLNHPEVFCFDAAVNNSESHYHHPDGRRVWDSEKYSKMVRFRNNLLDKACCINPDRYFSLDSDIILEDPNTISTLVELTERLPVVSPLTYMSPHTCEHPNLMTWNLSIGGGAGRDLGRYDMGNIFQADIIMAAVMMNKDVYQNIRYKNHRQGEDLGFAAECALNGYEMFCASTIYAPHIMHEWMLTEWLEGTHRINRSGFPAHLNRIVSQAIN